MRRTGIGASEIGAVLGLDRYKTPLDVWAEKTGLVAPDWSPKSQASKMGHLLEPVVAQLAEEHYAEQARVVSLVPGTTMRHPTHEWMLATPDRFVNCTSGDRWLLEMKTKSWHTFKGFGVEGTDQVPDTILLQALWQMAAAEQTRCDIAVLVDGREFAMFTSLRDDALLADVQSRVYDFWTRYVVARREPPVTSGSDVKFLQAKFREPTADLMRPSDEAERLIGVLAAAREDRKQAEAVEELAKARAMVLLGDYKGIHTTHGKVSWGTVKGRAKTDWEAVCAAAQVPRTIIEQHTTIGAPSRQFRFTPSRGE